MQNVVVSVIVLRIEGGGELSILVLKKLTLAFFKRFIPLLFHFQIFFKFSNPCFKNESGHCTKKLPLSLHLYYLWSRCYVFSIVAYIKTQDGTCKRNICIPIYQILQVITVNPNLMQERNTNAWFLMGTI